MKELGTEDPLPRVTALDWESVRKREKSALSFEVPCLIAEKKRGPLFC